MMEGCLLISRYSITPPGCVLAQRLRQVEQLTDVYSFPQYVEQLPSIAKLDTAFQPSHTSNNILNGGLSPARRRKNSTEERSNHRSTSGDSTGQNAPHWTTSVGDSGEPSRPHWSASEGSTARLSPPRLFSMQGPTARPSPSLHSYGTKHMTETIDVERPGSNRHDEYSQDLDNDFGQMSSHVLPVENNFTRLRKSR